MMKLLIVISALLGAIIVTKLCDAWDEYEYKKIEQYCITEGCP